MAAIFLFLCSCKQQRTVADDGITRMAYVTLTFDAPAMEAPNRALTAAQEKAVSGINLWLFHRSVPEATYHLYLTSTGNIPLSLVGGEYDYYAVANAGMDLGSMTSAQAAAYYMGIGRESDLEKDGRLLMASKGTLNAVQGATVPISLTRCTARLEFTLNVAPAIASQMTVNSVQVMCVPSTLSAFGDNHPADLAAYFDYTARNFQPGVQTVFYLPENVAGTICTVTDPRNKDKNHAPRGATYIRILATTATGRVEYYIYPGANATTDFNVRRNTRYVITATITGQNSIDTRMSVMQMSAEGWQGSYHTGTAASGRLDVRCTHSPDNWFDLSYSLSGGGTLLIDGVSRPAGQFYRVLTGGGSLSIPIAYTQYTVGNASVQFTLRDRYGFVLSSSMTTSYKLPYDPLQVYFTQWPSQIDYYDTGTSRLSISEANYTGNFVVKCSISGSAILYLNNRRIFDGEALDLAAGSHVFELSPRGNGEVSTSFTVTDSHGQSKVLSDKTLIVGMPDSLLYHARIPLEASLSVKSN